MENELSTEFCSYEQALALKELGFDEYCVGFFYKPNLIWYEEINQSNLIDGEVVAPLKQQVLRWFREEYKIHHSIACDVDTNTYDAIIFGEIVPPFMEEDKIFYTYEEAENACIDKLIEIAKQQVIS